MSADRGDALTVACGKHGARRAAVVCQHHLQDHEQAVGFVENSADPDDLQAWCDRCERYFAEEGGMTARFKKLNGVTIVCVECYAGLKRRHSRR